MALPAHLVAPRVQRSGACVASLLQLGSLITAELERGLRRRGLSCSAFNLLRAVAEMDGAAAPHQLSERLGVSRATVTGLLDSLERRGLVRRAPDAGDRRMLRVELTAAGRRLLIRLIPEHARALRRMFASLPGREQERLAALLNRLHAHVRRLR